MPLACRREQGRRISKVSDNAGVFPFLLELFRFKQGLETGSQSAKGCNDNVVGLQLPPIGTISTMVNEDRKLMFAGQDMSVNLSSPLIHQRLGRNDQRRMSVRIGWRPGDHECNGLYSLAEAHVVSKNTTFVVTLLLRLHPGNTNFLMLHQCHFETCWRLILLRLGGFANVLDAGDQVFDILGEILLLISPVRANVSVLFKQQRRIYVLQVIFILQS